MTQTYPAPASGHGVPSAPTFEGSRGPTASLVDGSIGRTLVRMTIPSMIGGIGLLSVFVVDAYFVSRLGTESLAVFGFVFPVALGLMYLAIGVGTGAGAAVGRLLGEGDLERRRRVVTNSMLLTVAAMTTTWLGVVFFGYELCTLLGAAPPLHGAMREYMNVMVGALWIFSIGVVAGAIMRAHGDARTPAIAMGLCSAVNLALDPIFIFGLGPVPALGVTGAGFATAIGAIVGVWISLVRMRRARQMSSVREAIETWREDWLRVARVAGPAGGVQLLAPMSQVVVTRLISASGPAAVAGLGVGLRVEVLASVVLIALSTTLSSFVAQNWGARERERVYRAMLHCLHFGLVWVGLLFVVAWLAGGALASLFSDEREVTEVLLLYTGWVLPTSGFAGVVMLTFGALNAVELPAAATLLSVARVGLLYLPFAWIGYEWGGVNGLFLGMAAANATGGLVVYAAVRRMIARERAAGCGAAPGPIE